MSSAAEILVIIVSVVLALFLLVGIVLAVYLIRLSAEIRKIAKSAQETVDTVGEAVQGFVRMTSPVFIARSVSQFLKKFQHKSRKGE